MAEKTTPRERTATSKSRGEKSRLPTITAAGANLVPGRLPEVEWLALLEAEQTDRDAGDILAELLERVMHECSKADAARQRVPFAVGRARDAILQIVQWRFLVRDEGETDPEGDGAWREDEEPKPCAADPWAHGSVPTLHVHLSPGDGEVSAAAEAGAHPAQPLCPSQDPSAGAILPVSRPSHPELPLDEAAIGPQPAKPKSPRARPAPLRLARPPALCPSPGPAEPPVQLEEAQRPRHRNVEESGAVRVSSRRAPLPPPSCTSPVTTQRGRPLRSKGVKREGSGTILGVLRLGPGSRPERWIRPQVEVLDLRVEAKLPARPRGAHWRSQGPGLVSPQPPSPVPRQLSALLGSARLAPGVTVRRGGRVNRGLCVLTHSEEEETEEARWDLRPMRPAMPFPAIETRQVSQFKAGLAVSRATRALC